MSAVSTYAEALFEAAEERGELEEVLEELQEFTAAARDNEELRLFFYGGQLTGDEKRRMIDSLTEGMRASTTNFLKVLADNDREYILEETLLRYEELVKERLGRVEVELVTAVEVSGETLERVRRRLGRVLEGKEVILETRVEPGLIGGAVFRYGGKMIDGSVRGRLESLRTMMLERGVV